MTMEQRKVTYFDMDEQKFLNERNEQKNIWNGETFCICSGDIKAFYYKNAEIELEALKDYGRGWYCYTVQDQNGQTVKRYVYVKKIEVCDEKGNWVYDEGYKDEYGDAPTVIRPCLLQHTVKDREYFESMVDTWKFVYGGNKRYADLVYNKPIWKSNDENETDGAWIIYCLDKKNRYKYKLIDDGFGNIHIICLGAKLSREDEYRLC